VQNVQNVFRAEVEEIQKHRWLESEKKGYDIGEEQAALDWTEKYAEGFRKNWENSKN
jgi:hypothetical protein